MPVTRIAAAQQGLLLASNLTSHTSEATFNVSPVAGPYTYAIAAYGWTGEVNISSSPLACTLNGNATTALMATPLRFDSNHATLMGWIFAAPPAGSNQFVVSHTSIPTGLVTRNRFLAVGVWSQATELDLSTITAQVVTAVGSGATTTNTVTVPSNLAASRVIGAHLVGKGKSFSASNGARVATPSTNGGGQLWLQEVRGNGSTASTATQSSTANWAAFGLNLDPAPLTFGAKGKMRAGVGRFGASVYRFANPHPDREYTVPRIGSDTTSSIIAGDFIRSADGVDMPVFAKDPDDTLDYTFHWTNHLADDDEIVHVEHTAGGSLKVFSSAFDGASTQVWINGGTTTVSYPVRIRFTTKKGRRHDRTFRIAGVQN